MGPRPGARCNADAVRRILASVGRVPVQLGGGLRDLAAVEAVLAAGVERAVLGTRRGARAGGGPRGGAPLPGPDRGRHRRARRLGRRRGLARAQREARVDLARELEDAGVAAIVFTDIGRDGMLQGPNLEATAELAARVAIPVIVSGGIRSAADVLAAAAHAGRGIAGAIVGRALYTGAVDLGATLEQLACCLKRIIPCLDVDKGRVVKGVRYVDHVDAGDPVEVARLYDEQEADEITFLDISASHEGRRILLDAVSRTAESVFMPLTVGGGVRSLQDVRDLLNAGADKVSIMTAAVENPELVAEAAVKIGSANLVVAIDCRASAPGRWEVCTHGGRRPTGLDAVEWAARMAAAGAGEILLTSMDRDGTRSGYDLGPAARRRGPRLGPRDRVRRRRQRGGPGGGARATVPAGGHAQAALAASIFHFRETTVGQVKRRLLELGVPVRPPSVDAPRGLR